MEKINYDNLGQDVYFEELKNGFKVYLVPFEDKKNYYAILGVRYGSNDVKFKCNNQEFTTPYGTAHFLEHKIFASPDGIDPFAYFAGSGVNTNASTTFDNTRYYIWGVNDLYTNLNYMLDFLLTPYFTDDNVSKEKGIIKEEIMMYDDSPEWVLDDIMRKNLFSNLPIKEKIAGEVSDIMEITKEDLYNAYNTFYRPDNMYLVIGGNIDVKEISKLLKKHEKLNQKREKVEVEKYKYDEPYEVKEEYKEIRMNIKIPKIRFSIKVDKKRFKDFTDIELNMYFGIILSIMFGSTSKFREKIILEGLTNGIYVEKNNFLDFITIDVTSESEQADILIDEIKEEFNNIVIAKKDFERLKKVWIASEIRMIDSVEMTVDNIYSDLAIFDKVYYNRTELIKSLNMKKLNKVLKNFDVSNQSLVMILPKEENV